MVASPLQQAAAALGWEVVGRCGGGEFGAHLVQRNGDRAVLKVWADPLTAAEIGQSVALADRARDRGQLVPRYLDVGVAGATSYSLQEWIDGDLPEPLTLAHARRLVELLDAHEGAAAGATYARPRWWRQFDPAAAFAGATGRLRAVADELSNIAGVDDIAGRTDDVVHGDYHHRNLLVRGRRVVTVFDWEGAHPGDRRADLFKLAWWCRALKDSSAVTAPAARWLRTQVETALTDAQLSAHAADVARWNLDFFARVHPETLDGWLLDAVENVLAPYWRG